jgi:hypothetical protein
VQLRLAQQAQIKAPTKVLEVLFMSKQHSILLFIYWRCLGSCQPRILSLLRIHHSM